MWNHDIVYHHLEDQFHSCIRIRFINTPICPWNSLKLSQPVFRLRTTADPSITSFICSTNTYHSKEPLLTTVTSQLLIFTHDVDVARWQNPLQTNRSTLPHCKSLLVTYLTRWGRTCSEKGSPESSEACARRMSWSTKKPILLFSVRRKPFLNALTVADSITHCSKLFQLSITCSEKKCCLKSKRHLFTSLAECPLCA